MRCGGAGADGGADGGNTEAQRHRGKPEMVERNGGRSGWKEFIWWSGRVGERSSFELFSLLELAESFASKRDRLV